MFNFDEIQGAVETRKNISKKRGSSRPKGQNYDNIKVMTNEKKTMFTFSNKLWEQFDLDNKAFMQAFPQGVPVFVLVEDTNDSATYFKSTTKGDHKAKSFKADILRDKLVSNGLLTEVTDQMLVEAGSDGKTGNNYQYLKLVEGQVPAQAPSDWLAIYTFEVDPEGGNVKNSDDDSDDGSTDTQDTAPQAEVEQEPQHEQVPAEDDGLGGF